MRRRTYQTKTNRESAANRVRSIATLGIVVALIIVLQLFAELMQRLGMPMSFALGLVPVLVISQTHGIKYGAAAGFVFGLISLIMAVIGASAIPMYAVAINPLVSVFPRIMVGVVCAAVYRAIVALSTRRNPYPTLAQKRARTLGASATATLCGVLTNTLLFLGMFLAFANGKSFDGLVIDFRWLLASVVALNTIVEAVLFTFLVPFIVLAVSANTISTRTPHSALEYHRIDKNEVSSEYDSENTDNSYAIDVDRKTENYRNVDDTN